MKTWQKLPNARHIDWVLKSLKTHKQLWRDTYIQVWDQTYYQALNQAWDQAREEVREEAYIQAREEAWRQAYDQAYDRALDHANEQARYQASGVLIALIAYDDSANYLSMTSDQLKVWIELSEDPSAILLLSMVQVKEKLKEMELV